MESRMRPRLKDAGVRICIDDEAFDVGVPFCNSSAINACNLATPV